jgi:DNA polymerase III alpha subunit
LEDEFGLVDVTIFENTYKRYGEVLFNSPLLVITGEISERDPNQITTVVANRITSLVS